MKKRLLSGLGALLLSAGCHSAPVADPVSNKDLFVFLSKEEPAEQLGINTTNFLKKYKISQDELEQKLCDLAYQSSVEEAWVYNPQTEVLREVGGKQTPLNVAVVDFLQFYQEGDHIILYHIHPTIAQTVLMTEFDESCVEQKSREDMLKTINTSHSACVPSYADIAGSLKYVYQASEKGITIESRIVDRQGILSVDISLEHAMRLGSLAPIHLEIFRSASIRYMEGKLSFDQLASEFKEKGIELSYKKIRDCPVTLEQLEQAYPATIASTNLGMR